ncbi:MAG: hypothetical protein JKY95_19765 [Planctomycetaceae bacterium]|nr:hypothetical protein [Planctomycetaceae bacterium]
MSNLEELKRKAEVDCIRIHHDFSEEEVNKMASSIQSAWSTGATLARGVKRALINRAAIKKE